MRRLVCDRGTSLAVRALVPRAPEFATVGEAFLRSRSLVSAGTHRLRYFFLAPPSLMVAMLGELALPLVAVIFCEPSRAST